MSENAYQIEFKAIKHYPFKLYLIYVLIFSTFFACVVFPQASTMPKSLSNPLLLNSGLVEAQAAELRIVVWFEAGKPSVDLKMDLPQEGWEWKDSYRNTSHVSDYSAYTLSGYKLIQAEEEKQIYPWFQKLSTQIKELGGVVYLDERVSEGIDIANYSVQQGINPIQWSLSEGTISVAGQQGELYPMVRAGEDLVNIQVISQAYDGSGKTALAIPVLLEEF